MIRLISSSVLAAALLANFQALAEPTLYPKDFSSLGRLRNQTNSNLLADESDLRTVWVMPPNTAQATVSGLHTKTANMGFCVEMGDLKDYSKDLSAQIHEIALKRIQAKEQLDKLQARADTALEESQKYAVEKNLTALSDLDTQIKNLEDRLIELYKVADSCTESCDKVSSEMDGILSSKNEMMKTRNQLAKQHAQDFKEYDRKKKVADAARISYVNAKNSYSELITELAGVQKTFRDSFSYFAQLEGARSSIRYTSSWDSNVAQLRQDNPGINFSKVATKNAKLMTEISGLRGLDPSGAIKAIELGGDVAQGVASFSSYPETLSANVVLSLIGACPMEHPEYFDLKDNDASKMEYGIIITYDYDSVFYVKATAQYNMHKMYQKIVSSGSSGGLFSSRSWSHVEERNFFSDSFKITWDDKENNVSPEQKNNLEQDMRHNVMMRLANLALPAAPSRAEVMQLAPPPVHGAVVVSESLMKVCPGNIYCQGGAVVFSILDAIFGSSSSSANYTNITDTTLTEDYSRNGKITKSWITSYTY